MFRRLWLLVGVLSSATAFADAYDFRIYQLGNPACNAPEGSPCTGVGYRADANANFRSFTRRLAAAMTSVNLAPPETLGHSAFAIGVELSVVDFGTAIDTINLPTTQPVQGAVLMPSVHIRKGLPWSFEVGVRAAWLEKSRMGAGTLELKWALNEGFTYLPDIGVRGYVTKLLNTRDFDVTAGGLDVGIGKQFAIAGMVTLTPYAGWNLSFVGATSGSVDFNPSRTLKDSDEIKDPTANQNFFVFDPVMAAQNSNNRFYGGFRFIAGVVQLGFEVSYTVLGSFDDTRVGRVEIPAVLAYNSMIGFDF
ncbi:MAG: hypothetical protein ACO1OB_24410 [Archangium sp.]